MDVELNKPCKDWMRKLYEAFMVRTEEANPKPGWLDVAQWVKEASMEKFE